MKIIRQKKWGFDSLSAFKMMKVWMLCLAFAFVSINALAACPAINSLSDPVVKNVNINGHGRGSTIYFCKQNFPQSSLDMQVTDTNLVAGGSQVLPQGNAAQTADLSVGSVSVAGFTPSPLGLNNLSGDFPNTNGQFGSPSLFNFYSRVSLFLGDCDRFGGQNQFDRVVSYLRNNANRFKSGMQMGITQNTGNDIARIPDAQLVHQISGKTILADIVFFHANAGLSGQYFTRGFDRYCWVGVGARMEIDGQNANIEDAGNYIVNVGVETYE